MEALGSLGLLTGLLLGITLGWLFADVIELFR